MRTELNKVALVYRPPPPPPPPAFVPVVSVVIVNYNSWPDVERLVDSLSASAEVKSGRAEIVVVDNASRESTPPSLRNARFGVRYVFNRENGGFAVGVNAGWRHSRGRWLLLLNPDVSEVGGLLGQVVSLAGRYEAEGTEAPGVVGFGLRNPDGTRQPSVGAFPNLFRSLWGQLIHRSRRKYQAAWRTKSGPVAWVTGACVLVDSRMLAALGGLDEEFFLYYEEVALCRAARRQGWRVEYDPSVEVVHLRPLQNRPVSPGMRVITRHSKLLYFRKHLPRWQFLGLCTVVALEARLFGGWARLRGRREDLRAWDTIARVERTLRGGHKLGGRDVLVLAESVASAGASDASAESAGKRPGS